jgi:hypothetical protein
MMKDEWGGGEEEEALIYVLIFVYARSQAHVFICWLPSWEGRNFPGTAEHLDINPQPIGTGRQVL